MRHRLPEKLYYSIGEVAEAFEVKPSLIRFWEKEFHSEGVALEAAQYFQHNQ